MAGCNVREALRPKLCNRVTIGGDRRRARGDINIENHLAIFTIPNAKPTIGTASCKSTVRIQSNRVDGSARNRPGSDDLGLRRYVFF